MEVTVNNSGKANASKHMRLLIAGAPGSNKTTLALQANNPLWINTRPTNPELAASDGVKFVTVKSEDEFDIIRLALSNELSRRTVFGQVDTVVIDTVDMLQANLMNGRLDRERRSDFKIEDWNWIAQRMTKMFENLVALPLDIIFLLNIKEDGGVDYSFSKPALQGGFSDRIHEFVGMTFLLKSAATEAEGEEVVVDVNETGSEGAINSVVGLTPYDSSFLVTRPIDRFDWLKDCTGLIPPILSVDENTIESIKDEYDGWYQDLPESDKPKKWNDLDVSLAQVDPNAAPDPNPTENVNPMPGMSSASKIQELLNNQKQPSK